MKFYMHEHAEVSPGPDGVSIVTVKIPSHMVTEVMELVDLLLYMSRWLRTRSRAAEAIYKARQLHIIP